MKYQKLQQPTHYAKMAQLRVLSNDCNIITDTLTCRQQFIFVAGGGGAHFNCNFFMH